MTCLTVEQSEAFNERFSICIAEPDVGFRLSVANAWRSAGFMPAQRRLL